MKAFRSAQAQLVLHNQRYAYILTALMAFLPFTEWLALAIIALVTLRKGWHFGLRLLIASTTVILIATSWAMQSTSTIVLGLIPYVLTYLAAVLLRVFASWKVINNIVLLASLFSLWIIHSFFPDFIAEQYQQLLAMFKLLGGNETLVNFMQINHSLTQNSLANYVLGIRVLGIVASVYCSLLIARSIQAQLFYPGEFRKELLAIRASKVMVIPLILSINGALQHHSLSISCLPLLLTYFTVAGLSLLFNFISKTKQLRTSIVLLLSFVLTPYILVPTFVLFGGLDSLFNFRLRLQKKVNA